MAGLSILAAILAAILASSPCSLVSGAKIVMFPAAGMSHVTQAENIANALIKNGHDLYMVLPDNYRKMDKYKAGPIKIIIHHTPEKDTESHDIGHMVMDLIRVPLTQMMSQEVPGGRENCRNVLTDTKMYQALKDLNPDLFIVDSFVFIHCVYIIPYRLGIPYASYGTTQLPESWARSPALPSFVPVKFGTPYTDKMTFLERLDNLRTSFSWAWYPKPPHNQDNWVERYAPDRPEVSLVDLLRGSSLWLVNNDVIMDYPRPLMPNEIYVGGLTTKPAKPLTDDLEKILSSAHHGVIVMSFGSGLPDLHSEKFLSVFAKLKQVVVWRHLSEYKGDVPVTKNVHMLKWLPQSDILGHNNTKLFITHAGANGQFEALYNGVPMLAFPAFADQAYNAKRMEHHGFGKVLNILSFTEGELELAIREILTEPSYSQRIKHASSIYRSRRESPAERINYWVNHVLQFGDSHLKSYALEMPWYSYGMLDVALFIAAVIIVIILISYVLLRKCCISSKQKTE